MIEYRYKPHVGHLMFGTLLIAVNILLLVLFVVYGIGYPEITIVSIFAIAGLSIYGVKAILIWFLFVLRTRKLFLKAEVICFPKGPASISDVCINYDDIICYRLIKTAASKKVMIKTSFGEVYYVYEHMLSSPDQLMAVMNFIEEKSNLTPSSSPCIG